MKELEKVLRVLRRYQVKLNLEKCIFVVSTNKFLRFMVSQRGIEVNLKKIKAILEMQALRLMKEVQKLAK